jgi:hypothetical protein
MSVGLACEVIRRHQRRETHRGGSAPGGGVIQTGWRTLRPCWTGMARNGEGDASGQLMIPAALICRACGHVPSRSLTSAIEGLLVDKDG